MLSLHQLALAALREEYRRRLRAIVRRNYPIWGPRASVDELYNEMRSHVGALCPAVGGLEDEWVGHAREFHDECCLEHLRAAVGQNYPIWGWCQAEAVADLVHNEVLAAVALRATSEEQRQRMYSQFQSGRLDGWINRAHQLYSFETCVHTLTRDIGPFLDAWWTASLGIWNAAAPNPSYHAAQRRGAYLYRVYCQPTPQVISPPGGLVHVLDPKKFPLEAGRSGKRKTYKWARTRKSRSGPSGRRARPWKGLQSVRTARRATGTLTRRIWTTQRIARQVMALAERKMRWW